MNTCAATRQAREVYSKGLLAAEEEALLAALGFHLFVYENYTHPPH